METNQSNEPNRADIDQLHGATMIEFGTDCCGYCRAAQPIIASTIIDYPRTLHIKIEDGKGRRLGRSYSIKLWPTLIFLKNGTEIKRLVRPDNPEVIAAALAEINIK